MIWLGAAGLLVVLGALTGYFAGSLFFRPPTSATKGEAEKNEKNEQKDGSDSSPTGSNFPALRAIDEMIEEDRFEQALAACREYARTGDAQLPALAYRRGLCLEGLGRPAEAAPAYREAVTRAASPLLQAAGQFGLARTALHRGAVDEARELLCALLCRSAQPAIRSRPYAIEASLLLALSLADELQPSGAPSARRPDALARAMPPESPGLFAGWDLPPPVAHAPGSPANRSSSWEPSGTFTVNPPGERAGPPRVEASLASTPTVEVLTRIARSAKLGVTWGPGAQDALLGRSVELVCTDAPLGAVLLWLTLPYGLVVDIDKGRINVRQASTLPAADLLRHRRDTASGALRDALPRVGGHPLSGYLYLALGNLAAAARQTSEAAGWYLRLARDRPRSAALVPAMYNLGLLRLRQEARPAARDAFFQAIDRTPGHEMISLCYWWIGRTHLDEGDTAGARRPLVRAMQGGPSPVAHATGSPSGRDRTAAGPGDAALAATLGLACADLLERQPLQAWNTLNAQRKAIQPSPFYDPAGLLDSMARYDLAAEDTKKRATALAELMSRLLGGTDEAWLGPILPFLQGRVLDEVGLPDEMITVYDRPLRTLRGPLADQMQFQVALALMKQGQDDRARARLDPLAKTGSKPWSVRATLRLAALDLRAGQADECLTRCRSLLNEEGVDRASILGLMSQAYTAKKEFANAAACLAGTIPPP